MVVMDAAGKYSRILKILKVKIESASRNMEVEMARLDPEERVLSDKNCFTVNYCHICSAMEYQPHCSICSAGDYTEKVCIDNVDYIDVLLDSYYSCLSFVNRLNEQMGG